MLEYKTELYSIKHLILFEIYVDMSEYQKNCTLVGEQGHRFYADDAWPVMKKLLSK